MWNIVRKLKLIIKIALKMEIYIKTDIYCNKLRLGSNYGGWEIVPANLDSQSLVYSFGIGEDASFDIELIKRYNLTIHAFDPTPRSIEWVKRQGLPENFIMHEYGLASFDGIAKFNPPDSPNHISHTMVEKHKANHLETINLQVKKISTIIRELGHDHIDIIKMDIEGAEYDVIDDMLKSGVHPKQLLIEFHHRFPGIGIEKTKASIDAIKSVGYKIFSISESREEYCFILIESL